MATRDVDNFLEKSGCERWERERIPAVQREGGGEMMQILENL